MGTKLTRAIAQGRTLFPRTRRAPNSRPLVLKPAKYNSKMGGRKNNNLIQKGEWKGMPMFNLTLEERKTCPRTCPQWEDCYGNNMPFASRYRHGSRLEKVLKANVQSLARRYPDGFVVRLHVLGDFYSVDYVYAWRYLVVTIPELHVYGFTHWQPGTPIGDAVTELAEHSRCRIFRSDPDRLDDVLPAAYTLAEGVEVAVEGSVLCPWYNNRTDSCLTCGLCWYRNKRTGEGISISFPRH